MFMCCMFVKGVVCSIKFTKVNGVMFLFCNLASTSLKVANLFPWDFILKCHKGLSKSNEKVQCYHIFCFTLLSNTVAWLVVSVWGKYLRFNITSFLHVINPSLHSTQGMSVFNMLLLRYHHHEQKSEWESNENSFTLHMEGRNAYKI